MNGKGDSDSRASAISNRNRTSHSLQTFMDWSKGTTDTLICKCKYLTWLVFSFIFSFSPSSPRVQVELLVAALIWTGYPNNANWNSNTTTTEHKHRHRLYYNTTQTDYRLHTDTQLPLVEPQALCHWWWWMGTADCTVLYCTFCLLAAERRLLEDNSLCF